MPLDITGATAPTAAPAANQQTTQSVPQQQARTQVRQTTVSANANTTEKGKNTMANNPFALRTNRGMSRSSTSEAMRKILEQLNKIVAAEKTDAVVDYTFIPLDSEKDDLNISALVVAGTVKNPSSDQKHVVFHTLLLASTARGVNVREMKVGSTGVSYERLVLPTDGMDDVMMKTIINTLSTQFPGYKPHSAEWTVIPSTLNLESEEAVRNMASNATTAVWTILASEVGGVGWVIERDLANVRLVADIKKSHTHFVGLDGLPVRSDTVIELNEVQGRAGGINQNEWQYNNGQTSETLVQLNGFFDLVSTPHVQAHVFGATNTVNDSSQLITYTPRFVVTNVDSAESCDLTLQLLGLASTQSLAEGNRLVQGLINQHKDGEAHPVGGINIRDLGAIGLEVPRMAGGFVQQAPSQDRFPTTGASFSEQSLSALIQTYVSPNLLISLDVPEGGPSTWMTSVFVAAARGDENAKKDIIAAADVLTAGRFSELYKQRCGGEMRDPVFDDNLIVNLGTYMDSTGLRDIRDISYLEVLNITGDKGLDKVIDWTNLQANVEVDEYFRATEARRILEEMFQSMQITGRARRVTFNNLFLFTLAQAIKQSGLIYETKTGMSAPTGTARMVNPYMANMATNLGSTGAFVMGGFNKSNPTTNAPGSFGRFAYQAQSNQGGMGGSY